MRVKNGAWIALNTLLRSKENCYQFDDTSENYYHWYCLRLDRGKGNVITIYDIVKEMRATLPSWTAAQNLISTQSWWLGLGTLYKIQPQHHPHRLYREKIMIGATEEFSLGQTRNELAFLIEDLDPGNLLPTFSLNTLIGVFHTWRNLECSDNFLFFPYINGLY